RKWRTVRLVSRIAARRQVFAATLTFAGGLISFVYERILVVRSERHCVHRYAKPRSVEEVLSLLGAGEWRVLAGGTDFYPAQGVRPIREAILDIGGLGELRGIAHEGAYWRIGATTSWSDVARAALP